MIKLVIQNETGHTEMASLASSEVIEQIDTHPTHWVFVDDIMVSRETINEINWDEVSEVHLTPAIVGGQ